jgi:predicted Zn-dependent protease
MNLRPQTCLLAFALAFAVGAATAQERNLPDIGSSAANVLSPAKQAEYGAMVLAQLRHEGYVLDDPLLDGWLNDVGQRLAAASNKPQQPFTFFLLRERQINAFATLGGYVAMNSGLVLAADQEDEVAGVLAHEISHVTQQHMLRGAEKAQRESLPILLATLGAIVAAQKAGGNSSGDAASAALMTGMGLLQQRQIDYTRDNEAEADRIGIRTLANAGYNPEAMADFFVTLQGVVRMNQGDERAAVPGYLQTHPLTLARISEARERAAKLVPSVNAAARTGASTNPLLPPGLQLGLPSQTRTGTGNSSGNSSGNSGEYAWARERLRVLSANTPAQAIREYQQMRSKQPLDAASQYGLAIAHQQAGDEAKALQELTPLAQAQPANLWVQIALGEAEAHLGKTAEADRRFEVLLARMPTHRALALSYAHLLGERNTRAAGLRAVAVLRPLLGNAASNDLPFQQTYARANEIAGDPARAGEAWAEAAYLSGRPEQALVQLNNLKKRDDLDYYARARIDARIAAITPTVLELRRQGVHDEEVRGGKLSLRAEATSR